MDDDLTRRLRYWMDEERNAEHHYRADTIALVIDRMERQAKVVADVWREGYEAGYEHAPMDRYSEPDPEPLPNPYAPEESL